MRRVDQWLEAYGESHQNPTNKLIHWICVPVILVTLIGALWGLKLPVNTLDTFMDYPLAEFANLGVGLMIGSLLYYALLSIPLMMGMIGVSVAAISAVVALDQLGATIGYTLLELSLALFVLAWIGQFIGHKIEGKKPSFFEDLQFLLIGPLWLLSFIYRRLGLKY